MKAESAVVVPHSVCPDSVAEQLVPISINQRACSRELSQRLIDSSLFDLGYPTQLVSRMESGARNWPRAVTGSLSYSDKWAICILAHSHRVAFIGVDIEPIRSMTVLSKAASVFLNSDELNICYRARHNISTELALTLSFSAKEAAMKALSPRSRQILPFNRFEIIDLDGTTVHIRVCQMANSLVMPTLIYDIDWVEFQNHVITRLLYPSS